MLHRKTLEIFLVLMVALFTGCGQNLAEPRLAGTGYLAVAHDGASFIAAGTGGRLDRIFEDGRLENIALPVTADLAGVWADGRITLVCGADGTLLYSTDGVSFMKADTGTKAMIYGIAFFKGKYFACAQNGLVLVSEDGVKWRATDTGVKNDIISIGANDRIIMGITSESDILISEDGLNWKNDNFNKTYEGYYSPYVFSSLRNMGESFFVVGYMKDDPGSPLIMFSERGEVWMHKPLTKINDEPPEENLPITIYAIGYDMDSLVAVCDKGRVLTVDDCAECNRMAVFSGGDFFTLALGNEKLLVAGQDFEYKLLDSGP